MTTEDTTHVRLLIEIKREIEAVHSQCVEINQMVRQLDERLLIVEEKLAVIDTRMWAGTRHDGHHEDR